MVSAINSSTANILQAQPVSTTPLEDLSKRVLEAIRSKWFFMGNGKLKKEAAAAGCVIISDRVPCIVDAFKDTLLYVDAIENGEELFKQIDQHVQWIHSHPKEAEAMARSAHAIFMEHFSQEKQLLSLIDFHRNRSSL